MNFSSCQYIRKLPNLLSATPNIKELNLRECKKLVELHDFVGCLAKLEGLDLENCIKLLILPSCISMKSLKLLNLFGNNDKTYSHLNLKTVMKLEQNTCILKHLH